MQQFAHVEGKGLTGTSCNYDTYLPRYADEVSPLTTAPVYLISASALAVLT